MLKIVEHNRTTILVRTSDDMTVRIPKEMAGWCELFKNLVALPEEDGNENFELNLSVLNIMGIEFKHILRWNEWMKYLPTGNALRVLYTMEFLRDEVYTVDRLLEIINLCDKIGLVELYHLAICEAAHRMERVALQESLEHIYGLNSLSPIEFYKLYKPNHVSKYRPC